MKQIYKSIIIILFFISLKSYSQTQEAIIYFKDGDSIEGFASIKNDKIKFKISADDKADTWDYENVKEIKFIGFDIVQTYEYIKLNSSDDPKLLELIVEGNVCLYKEEKVQFFTDPNITKKTAISTHGTNNINNYAYQTEQSRELFYVKRKKDQYPTYINSGILSNWKKTTINFFADCDFLVKKIKDNKYGFNQINDIVEFYNDICRE
ncbi:hypothetical protein [Flavobacterium pectinovorum]|uniref:Uncharacterized protein n=1 Tax=Flavobacterium pectinovorum TaxID=29533 RepID=A0A502EWF0_9FLAO|nr:hypothetical protein [Flavobacterium pectinovorum]TPG42255.1 hypothetical protein EAH81_08030 [Flavobacterium pectinovorum]